jgi:hypothetical protein
MNFLIKKLFPGAQSIRTFTIARLHANEVLEKVFLKQGSQHIDITLHHAMICLDPFCVAIWLTTAELVSISPQQVSISFVKGKKLNALINLSLIEPIPTSKGTLLLYKVERVANYQLTPLHRIAFFAYLLRSLKNTYYSRRVIGALYSYPRRIIIVSYKDDTYTNIFPMDIQGFIEEEGLCILGLRTTNITLDKILETKRVVVCDTNAVDINTVYNLGKHKSAAPTPESEMPFKIIESDLFRFPVPAFVGGYREIEIIQHKKMGYHMLLVGRVLNDKKLVDNPTSLYHVGFLQAQTGDYKNIDGLF